MRELKFRVWDPLSHPPKMLYFDFDDLLCGMVELHPGSCDWELMQYIGRRDKNEKEIYAEDIVLITMADKTVELFVVKWSENATGFRFIDKDGLDWKVRIDNILEVVGNAFENPELLKK